MKRLALLLCLLAFPAHAADTILFAPVKTQNLNFSTVQTKATDDFSGSIEGVRLVCSTDCYVAFGVSAGLTATAGTGIMVPANQPTNFKISGGNIAVIQVSATGRFSITEMSK